MKKPKFITEFEDIPAPRAKMPELPLDERKLNFTEVELGLAREAALAEASRCLSCRRCIGCGLCLAECDPDAIVYDMEASSSKATFDAVVAAPGAEPYNPAANPALGYSESANIVTTLELERMLNPTGPYGGLPIRPGDGTFPSRVAFVQCVGSRDEGIGAAFCSSSCCTQALEQAASLGDALGTVSVTFFHREMRPLGRRGEELLRYAEENDDIDFVFAGVTGASGVDCEGPVIVKYDTGDGDREREFDLVVLSVGQRAPGSTRRLARSIGGKQNKFGYVATTPLAPTATGEDANPVAGTVARPMDVGGAVAAGSAAASQVLNGLDGAVESDPSGAESGVESGAESGDGSPVDDGPAVVALCKYGLTTAGLDVSRVSHAIGESSGAPWVITFPTACVTPTVRELGRLADERRASRLLIVGCYPETHSGFWRAKAAARIDRPLAVEIIGGGDGADAESVARAAGEWLAGGSPERCTDDARVVENRTLVVGAGVSGLSAAAELARRGVPVTLVEAGTELAPRLRGAAIADPDAAEALAALVERVEAEPAIEIATGSTVASVERTAHGFESVLTGSSGETRVTHGALVLAAEATDYDASAIKGASPDSVITQRELTERLRGGAADLSSVVMIQCVGSRTPEHPYCSRNCCAEALANLHRILGENPETEVTVLHKGIRVWGFDEEMFSDAIDAGVRFVRVADTPAISDGASPEVTAVDAETGDAIRLAPDLVVLSTGVVAAEENAAVAGALGVDVDGDGFLRAADEAVAPVRSRCDGSGPCERQCEGVFICGSAAWPASIEDCVTQAQAAAGKASLHIFTKGPR